MHGPVFVTGGSGFVGTAVIEELLRRDYLVHALSHRRGLAMGSDRVTAFEGDLFDPAALSRAMAGCTAVIHLVGIIMENPKAGVTFERIHFQGTKAVVDATKAAGIRRYLHMSALGTRPNATSNYHRTKYAAEQYVRESGLDWTIFRPSLIHGPKGEFMQMETAWARKKAAPFFFMPYFGAGLLGRRGAGKLQPVYVNDVARAFADALEKPKTIGEVIPLAGPDEMTWRQMHKTVAKAVLGKDRATMPVPAWYAKALTHVVPRKLLPFNRDQVIMSQEKNTTDLAKMRDCLGWEPRGFEESLKEYAAQL